MTIEDRLSNFMTDDEKDILKSMMLKDNLYRQDIYYNNYLKQLEKKYLKKNTKYFYIVLILIIASFVYF